MHPRRLVGLVMVFGCGEAPVPTPSVDSPVPALAPVPATPVPTTPVSATPQPAEPGPVLCTGTLEANLRCEVERSVIEDTAGLARQARLVPRLEDGTPIGVALSAIRAGSLPNRLGLMNGDLLLAVDDRSLADLDAVLTAWPELIADDQLTLRWRRDASDYQTTLVVVDQLSGPARDLGTATLATAPSGRPAPIELGDCEATDTLCELDAAGLRAALAESRARCVPALDEGRILGLKLFGIRAGSLESELGLRNGDVILGLANETLDGCLPLYEPLRTTARITVQIRRANQTLDRTYVLL